jgi:hypothetical protein
VEQSLGSAFSDVLFSEQMQTRCDVPPHWGKNNWVRWLILLSLLLGGNAGAQKHSGQNKLQISVVAAMQPSAPLQVSGVSMPSKRKAYGAVVHNSSTKKITEYELWWIAAAPPGCGHVPAKTFNFSRTIKSDLDPDKTDAEQASEVNISDFQEVAEKLQTDFLQVQVGIVRANFEHHASWHENDLEDFGVFMPSVLEADREKCNKK